MKTTILISLLCIASIGSYAQDNAKDQSATKTQVGCRKYAEMPKGAVPAWPKSAYIPTGNPECAPCYTYTSKHGLTIMECPGLWFLPEGSKAADAGTVGVQVPDNSLNVVSGNTYTGNYPKVCKRDPDMPRGAVPVWPKDAYTPTQSPECAPCYEYTRKSGLTVMECPFLYFPAEKDK